MHRPSPRSPLRARTRPRFGRATVLALAMALVATLATVGLAAPAQAATTPAGPTGLTVQGMTNPVDLDVPINPLFGWQPPAIDRTTVAPTVPDQADYQILVSSSLSLAQAGTGDVWNSGEVASGQSTNVAYRGPALKAANRYWLTVRTWDGTGVVSAWSTPSTFGTGPGATWTGATPIWSQTPTNAWTNYTIAGDFVISKTAATILFRGHDSNNYYLWQFQQAKNQLVAQEKRSGVYSTIATIPLAPLGVTLRTGAVTGFSITASGTTITTKVSGKTVDTRTDSTFASGFIGLQTGHTETTTFSNLTVTAHDGTSLWKQSPTSTVSDFSCASATPGRLDIGLYRSCLYDPWQNYVLKTTYKATAHPTGITFRDGTTTNGYLWQFDTATSTLIPQVDVDGAYSKLPTSGALHLGRKVVVGQSYPVQVEVNGSQISTWFDGQLIDRMTNTKFSTGVIGFRNGGSETTSFSSLSVRSLSGATIYSNGFEDTSIDVPCGLVKNHVVSIGTSNSCLIRSGSASNWLFARSAFTLPDKAISWASVYATGSSPLPSRQYVYKLYLNGKYVGMGPTQSITNETRYDGYDVTSDLVQGGANALGAQLYTMADHRFIADLVVHYTDGTTQTFGTSPSWTTLPGLSVLPNAGSIGTAYYSAPKENIDAAHFPFGYATASFDDSGWDPAEAMGRFTNLKSTPTGKVVQKYRAPVSITQEGTGNYLVDFGTTTAGGVRLTLTAPGTTTVKIQYGEVLDPAKNSTSVKYDTSSGNDYEDAWTYSGGTQTLESWGLRVFRYVEILNSPQPITADNLQAAALLYPFDETAATFSSSDSTLNAVWQLSRNTIEDNSVNLYVDSWTRERGSYEADAYIQQTSHSMLGSDATLGIYTIDYLMQHPSGPTEWHLYDVLSVHDTYEQTGDLSQAVASYNFLKTTLLTPYLDSKTGLIKHIHTKDIVDWPAGERDGYVMTDYDSVVNELTYRDLVDMVDLARATGHASDAATYATQAANLRHAINTRLFDAKKGAYRDGLVTTTAAPINHYAIQASAFALAFGVVDSQNYAAVTNYIQSLGMVCSVYCAAIMLPGLYSANAGSIADAFLTSTGTRSWVNMIKAGAGSTMEAWDASLKSNTTYSHPWAASPTYDVTQGMFGIQPTSPGYSTFSVKPQPGAIDHASVTLPTIRGSIGAAYDLQPGGHIDGSVQVPSTTTATVTLPAGVDNGTTVYVDGVARPAVKSGSWLTVSGLPSGCHVLSTVAGDRASTDANLLSICTTPYRDGAAS